MAMLFPPQCESPHPRKGPAPPLWCYISRRICLSIKTEFGGDANAEMAKKNGLAMFLGGPGSSRRTLVASAQNNIILST